MNFSSPVFRTSAAPDSFFTRGDTLTGEVQPIRSESFTGPSPAQVYRPSPPASSFSRSIDAHLAQDGPAQERQDDREVSLFLRLFSEGLGKGMAIFGYDEYFSREALLLARQSDLVKYAACAAAAKQLGHMKNPEASVKPSNWLNHVTQALAAQGNDYLWCGAKYYGKSIQTMAAQISVDDHQPNADQSPYEIPWALASPNSVASSAAPREPAEPRFLAACIMCQYEQLSASTRAWAGHLNGIFRLLRLDKIDAAIHEGTEPPSPAPTVQSSRTLQSLFWHFVQNDFEESYITSKDTRVDLSNVPLWRRMGLPLDDDGRLPKDCFAPDPFVQPQDQEMVALHAMIRLMCQVVNLISTTPRTALSVRRRTLDRPGDEIARSLKWSEMNQEFNSWIEAVPPSFQPDISHRRGPGEHAVGSEFLTEEVWFANNACAMGMIYYHMGKQLLLVNKPKDLLSSGLAGGGGPSDWLMAYRTLQRDLARHARALLSIALGNPDAAVRMHLLQPLYVAGRSLTTEPDQRLLIEMLEAIEGDLGIATGYRVRALIQEWGISMQGTSILDRELSDLSSAEDQ